MTYNRVDLELTVGGHGSSLKVDGTEIKGIRSIKVEAAHDAVTEVTVTFLAYVNCDPPEAA